MSTFCGCENTKTARLSGLMPKEKFTQWYCSLQQLSKQYRWRSLIVVIGAPSWVNDQVQSICSYAGNGQNNGSDIGSKGLIYHSLPQLSPYQNIAPVSRKNYNQQLGTEQQVVIFPMIKTGDNDVGSAGSFSFDVDAFAALSGTIVAGGSLIITISHPKEFDELLISSEDYFSQRFWRLINAFDSYIIRESDAQLPKLAVRFPSNVDETLPNVDTPSAAVLNSNSQQPSLPLPYACVTSEQVLAVEAMLKVMSGHRDRPLVLTADRGRGKSSAMALAVCQLLMNAKQKLKIVLTAASRAAVQVFFIQVERHLPDAVITQNRIEHANGTICFMPIDLLLKEQPETSLVMVDEAAALPIYLLQRLLSTYHRLVFASTVHGYEGAGRGFSIKFRIVLNNLMPQWRKMHIHEPIRWAAHDPLESFVFSSCLLNASLPNYSEKTITSAENTKLNSSLCSVEKISALTLLANETLLQQVFSVLVTAHYQTSPSDVKYLLNNRAISLFVLKRNDNILGVAMLMLEGKLSSDLVALVKANKRRVRDQFIPQSLLMHSGIKDSFDYRYQRVMRIAIHPQYQGQGLGQYFLTQIEQQVEGVDFIGSSFAGNASLLNFWQQCHYSLARMGFSQDKASGEHSCLVLKSLNKKASFKQQQISQGFYQQFDYWLTDEFKKLPAKMVWQVLHHRVEAVSSANALNTEHLQTVNDFVSGQRQFSSCVYSLHQWLVEHCQHKFDPDVLPLIARIFQKHSVEQVCADYQFTGKKLLNQHLLNYIGKYVR